MSNNQDLDAMLDDVLAESYANGDVIDDRNEVAEDDKGEIESQEEA